ncbi:unnamed protein product [Dicrocoelium dendriticum]|nr:unnamed protein product [Dicrocoelium dendriticum]
MESDGVIVEPAHDNVSKVDDLKRRSKGDGTENGDATSNGQTEELIVKKAKVVDIPEKLLMVPIKAVIKKTATGLRNLRSPMLMNTTKKPKQRMN